MVFPPVCERGEDDPAYTPGSDATIVKKTISEKVVNGTAINGSRIKRSALATPVTALQLRSAI